MISPGKFLPRNFAALLALFALCLAAISPPTTAQDGKFDLTPKTGRTLVQQGLAPRTKAGSVEASAKFHVIQGTNQARLIVTVEIPKGHHIFALTQRKPLIATEVIVTDEAVAKVSGPFIASREPLQKSDANFNVPLEEYDDSIEFRANLEMAAGSKIETATIPVSLSGQLCTEETCTQFDVKTEATFAGYLEVPQAAYKPQKAHVTLTGQMERTASAGSEKLKVQITATPLDDYHIYANASRKGDTDIAGPTLFVWPGLKGWKITEPVASTATKVKDGQQYHEGPVTWTFELTSPYGVTVPAELIGLMGLQTCAAGCDPPTAVEVHLPLDGPTGSAVPVLFSAGTRSYKQVNDLAIATVPQKEPVDWGKLGLILVFAFVGGAILNLMPCVLPVIGLKVLSFARQGGQSHARVFGLNLFYSAGLISVFLILAGLAAFLNFGWGDQFQFIEFKITMTAVVFVMALSFLGVWELPVPGFATSGKAGELQNQHGYGGAFFKGMFTTLLATPCSGPFLGAVFPFAIKQQPAIIFLIFGCIGLGMAAPYLIIGIFPGMVKFLPKPGEWMETFERVMGFVLLGTVVYLFSTFGKEYQHLVIPTLALLIALWFGCWLIGQVPEYAGWGKRAMTWLAASAVAGVVGYGAFVFTVGHYVKWEPYDEVKLAQHLKEGRTVMIDFTADWCPQCKWNLAWAVDTRRVSKLTEENGVIAMIADKTNPSPHIDEKLRELDSNSIPVLAIYPGKTPSEPIILRDALYEGQVLTALEKAGPSKKKPEEMTTAMTPSAAAAAMP